jgi:hypothetical protein
MPSACAAEPDKDAALSRRQYRAWLADPQHSYAAPANAETLAGSNGHDVVMSPIESWVDSWNAELCVTDTAQNQKKCHHAAEPDGVPLLYTHRLALGFSNENHAGPSHASWVFPVHPMAGETRRVYFPEDGPTLPPRRNHGASAGCEWRVVEADGLEVEPALPANPVRLTSRTGAPGRIVVERVGNMDCGSGGRAYKLPCLWETLPDDPAWMRE